MRHLLIVLFSLSLLACDSLDKPTISLYLAVQRGDIDQLERHIHWQADINAPFSDGRYPLHEAADKGRLILLRRLLKHQAKWDVRDSQGLTPLDMAVLSGRIQAVEILQQAGATLDASGLLLMAAERQLTDRDIVRFLAGQGADLENTNAQGETPLLVAIRLANQRLVAHLIEQGANVNARNAAGDSALRLARRKQLNEIEQRLLRYGASN